MSLFCQFDDYDEESVIEAIKEAMNTFRQCPIGHLSGTSRYITHIFFGGDDNSLSNLLLKLSVMNIDKYTIEEDMITDSIGLSHIVIRIECEDKIVLEVPTLSARVLSVIEVIKDLPIEYFGWSCSDNAGISSSDTGSSSDFGSGI